ncbi:hypothetical protein CHARACLAT_009482 [Characodon lateralis]|uniref:Uncharacterized protein n=1 Tax=Characodon lateralis TaxID=208331 RepID=A0ABU7EHP5_9TELE|nr:hypothetical protein [Characodon lateralis]
MDPSHILVAMVTEATYHRGSRQIKQVCISARQLLLGTFVAQNTQVLVATGENQQERKNIVLTSQSELVCVFVSVAFYTAPLSEIVWLLLREYFLSCHFMGHHFITLLHQVRLLVKG